MGRRRSGRGFFDTLKNLGSRANSGLSTLCNLQSNLGLASGLRRKKRKSRCVKVYRLRTNRRKRCRKGVRGGAIYI